MYFSIFKKQIPTFHCLLLQHSPLTDQRNAVVGDGGLCVVLLIEKNYQM